MKPGTVRSDAIFVLILVAGIVAVYFLPGCHLHVLESGSTNDPVLVEWKDEITVQVNTNTLRIAEEHPNANTEADHPTQ